MEEERAEEGRAKVFEGPEYTSSFCHAKEQAWGGGLLLQIRSVHVGTCDIMKLALQFFLFFFKKKPSLQRIHFIGKCRLVAAVIFYFS